jgi:hypothetical protein
VRNDGGACARHGDAWCAGEEIGTMQLRGAREKIWRDEGGHDRRGNPRIARQTASPKVASRRGWMAREDCDPRAKIPQLRARAEFIEGFSLVACRRRTHDAC